MTTLPRGSRPGSPYAPNCVRCTGAAAPDSTLRLEATRGPARLRLSVVVFPDAFYTAFFEALLRQGAGRGEAQIREALAASRRSAFTVFTRDFPLP